MNFMVDAWNSKEFFRIINLNRTSTFNYENDANNQIEISNTSKYDQFKCLFCLRTFSTKNLMETHVEAMHIQGIRKQFACKICHKTGTKGYYQIKFDWLSSLDLPSDFEIKKHLVCFRHFKRDDFYFTAGDQIRLKKGM